MMVKDENKYSQMQKTQMNKSTVSMAKLNHKDHNENPDYWNILLSDIKKGSKEWDGKTALDFGCGCGRNVENLVSLADWANVDGIDISENNIEYCRKSFQEFKDLHDGKCKFFVNNGVDLKPIEDETYDFVMATIVFQHICVHEIRYSLKSDIYRVMKSDGIFSFQMTFGDQAGPRKRDYYDNFYDAEGTNSICDTIISNPQEVIKDLDKIGFQNITYEITPSFSDETSKKWIYFRCNK